MQDIDRIVSRRQEALDNNFDELIVEDVTARSSRRRKVIAGRVGVLAVIVGVWQLIAGHIIKTLFLPKPWSVLVQLGDWIKNGSLFSNIATTITPAAEGFVMATVAALVIGYGLASSRFLADILEPYIIAVYGVPTIALVPLLVIWFGIGPNLSVAIAGLASFFLLFYNVYFGIRDVSQLLVEQVSIMGGSRWDLATRVRLPSALVWLTAGTKLAVPHAILGVVVAEFLVGNKGIGYLLSFNASESNSAGVFASVFVLGAMVFIVDRFTSIFTRRALMWKEVSRRN